MPPWVVLTAAGIVGTGLLLLALAVVGAGLRVSRAILAMLGYVKQVRGERNEYEYYDPY